jgi:hypothetical protein
MKRTTQWGITGALALLVIGGVCAAVPYDSVLYQPAHKAWYVCYPVIAAWQGTFSLFGIEGDSGMRFIPLMLASVALYLGAVGFALGALLGKLTKHQ